jgi:hypothetical protein
MTGEITNMFKKEYSKLCCKKLCSSSTNCVSNGIITLHPPLIIILSKLMRYKGKVCFKSIMIISNVTEPMISSTQLL